MSMTDYRINPKTGLEFGLYSLGDHMPDALTGERVSAKERVNQIIQEAKLAEDAGLDFFSIGESHQQYFVGQAHAVLLGAVAQATSKIKLGSAATIVSTSDPVRIYENFATIDLLSNGRAEIIGGRASRLGLFELLGYNVSDYEELFEEKFELLLKIIELPTIKIVGIASRDYITCTLKSHTRSEPSYNDWKYRHYAKY
ncbi:LLM class flavin-dependent oxidoreductase, partial [Ligilactobacillus agilis]|uniref:LLM class flavin-dependent oxidoreductase n=1 Tax=Ligilactobacillus agilis TaxID=1601 RepID=UPI001559C51A